jgi:hypothetical protein
MKESSASIENWEGHRYIGIINSDYSRIFGMGVGKKI